jgi:Fe-Mn family superoxide dismutase
LAPHLSLDTLQYHYGKHHQAYVDNLNKLIHGTEFAELSLEAIVKRAPAGPSINHAAQPWNHAFFWQSMKPGGGGSPTGALAEAIAKTWGSVDKFHNLFLALAVGHFGSGWTWLVTKCDGSLGELAIRSQELRIAPSGNAKRPCPARAAGPAARRRAWAREAPGEAGR